MKVTLEHPSGVRKEVKKGYSWTFLFFGLFVPLIRGDIKWAVIMFLLQSLAGAFTFGVGAVVVSLIFSFTYNKIYIKGLLEKGYVPQSEEDRNGIKEYINA